MQCRRFLADVDGLKELKSRQKYSPNLTIRQFKDECNDHEKPLELEASIEGLPLLRVIVDNH